MPNGSAGVIARQFSRLFAVGTVSGLGEGALLERFLAQKDEAAFDAILTRYGPMVLSICRRWLDDPNDVDDAFQATFLVLVRRAGTLRRSDLLGNWLYGVAQKVARRARIDAAKRRDRDRSAAKESEMNAGELENHPDDFRPLHDEISRLPESYRAAILLCYFQGLSHEEAADRLGWPIGTVKGRLSRARDKLRDRLTRRGVTMPSASLISVLAREGRSAVPEILHTNTLRAALSVAAGRSMATVAVSAGAVALTEGVVSTMYYAKLKIAAIGLIAAATFAAGAGAYVIQHAPGQDGASKPVEKEPAVVKNQAELTPPTKPASTSQATLASLQAERELYAKTLLERAKAFFENGQITVERYIDASRRLMDVQVASAHDAGGRELAIKAHIGRVENANRAYENMPVGEGGGPPNMDEARAALVDAKYLLAESRLKVDPRQVPGLPNAAEAVGNVEDPPDDEAEERKNAAIRAALEKTIPMTFSTPAPLSDVIKYIKESTHSQQFPDGLPIYVDPTGFEGLDGKTDGKSINSPITLNMEGVPLKRTLKLVLDQLDLAFTIEHGLLVIDSSGSPRMPWVKERIKQQREAGMARAANMRLMGPPMPGNPGQGEPAATKGSPLAFGGAAGMRRAGDQPAAPAVSPEVTRIAKEKLTLARELLAMEKVAYENARTDFSTYLDASKRVAELEFEVAETDKERVAALRSQLEIARKAEAIAAQRVQSASGTNRDQIKARLARIDVEYRLAKMGVPIEATSEKAAPPVNLPPPPAR